MIIVCPCGEKKFEVDESLIPKSGRTLQCGTCDHKWFFKKTIEEKAIEKPLELTEIQDGVGTEIENNLETIFPKKPQENQIDNNYVGRSNFKLSKILNYFIVLIITAIAAIIFLDTFKNNLIQIFPNLELFLYNFFETIKDINLFIKDLIN